MQILCLQVSFRSFSMQRDTFSLHYVETVEGFNSIEFHNSHFLYLDTETIGLFGKIRLVQLYQSAWEDKVVIVDTEKVPLAVVFNKIKDLHVVGHNILYDLRGFKQELGETFKNWKCTQLALRLVAPQLDSHSLDSAVTFAYNRDIYRDLGIDKKEMQKVNWDKEITDVHKIYAALDVYLLPKVMKLCVDKEGFDLYSYKLDAAVADIILEFEEKGLPVCPNLIEKKRIETEEEIQATQALLPNINVNSYRQVRAALKLHPEDSSDDYVLSKLEASSPDPEVRAKAANIRKLKKLRKLLSFITKFITDDGRIYGKFSVGARSGRTTCQDQNLQNIPSALKETIQTDNFFVYADFSNLELRTFAAMVGESVMADKLKRDEDLHSFVASKIFEDLKNDSKIKALSDKEKRQIAKIFNFSSLYGAGIETRLGILTKYTGISLEPIQGEKIDKAWRKVFPVVDVWQKQNRDNFYKKILGSTALGRQYKAQLPTEQNNVMIQGTGAEVAKLGLVFCKQKGLDMRKLCVFVHDSYTFECSTLEEAKHYAKVLAESMAEAWASLTDKFKIRDIPMPVTAVVNKNWYACQEKDDHLYSFKIFSNFVQN